MSTFLPGRSAPTLLPAMACPAPLRGWAWPIIRMVFTRNLVMN